MRWLALLLFVLAFASTPSGAPGQDQAPVVDASQPFADWLATLHQEALDRGFSESLLSETLADLEPLERVVQADRSQAELNPGFARYLSTRLTPAMIRRGKEMSNEHQAVLSQVERKFGVQRRFLLALWGIETRYGRVTGNTPVFQALATLAWEPRRAGYFRGELFNALTMVQRGHIESRAMTGSWAGAMGQTQFMPSSYLSYAVDFDGDGRRDIWKSTGDALGSIANYLNGFGWNGDETWGREVKVSAAVRDEIARTIPRAHRGLLCPSQYDRASSARGMAEDRCPPARGKAPAAGGPVSRARGRRRTRVPRLSELRRDPRLQLRALLRTHGRAVVGPAALMGERSKVSSQTSSGKSKVWRWTGQYTFHLPYLDL